MWRRSRNRSRMNDNIMIETNRRSIRSLSRSTITNGAEAGTRIT